MWDEGGGGREGKGERKGGKGERKGGGEEGREEGEGKEQWSLSLQMCLREST
jgi:hypothetical protein